MQILLTLNVQLDHVALPLPLRVDGPAPVRPSVVLAHPLQHQRLVVDRHPPAGVAGQLVVVHEPRHLADRGVGANVALEVHVAALLDGRLEVLVAGPESQHQLRGVWKDTLIEITQHVKVLIEEKSIGIVGYCSITSTFHLALLSAALQYAQVC